MTVFPPLCCTFPASLLLAVGEQSCKGLILCFCLTARRARALGLTYTMMSG